MEKQYDPARVDHTVLHVVAEQSDPDAGIVELSGDGLPCLGVGRGPPLGEFGDGGLPFGLLPGVGGAPRPPPPDAASGGARQCFERLDISSASPRPTSTNALTMASGSGLAIRLKL